MSLSKSLGNGVPIGACLAKDHVAAPMTPGSHGTTFGGNPLAASAALAVVNFLEQNRMDIRAAELGKRILDGFRKSLNGQQGIKQIRGYGLMTGIELEQNCADLVQVALEHGLLINVTADKVIRLLPPLIISDTEADQIVGMVSTLIKDFLKD